MRASLISAEVALSLVLLIIACLMIRSFAELRGVRPGVDGKNVLAAAISLPDSRYGPEAISRFSKTLLDKVKALPGVKSAANRSASPGYWETVGIPLLAGRDFTERDGRGFDAMHPQTSALTISESMSRKYWPEGHALGQRVYFGDENSPRYQVVGIVGDALIDLEKAPGEALGLQSRFARRIAERVKRTASNRRKRTAGIASAAPLSPERSGNEAIADLPNALFVASALTLDVARSRVSEQCMVDQVSGGIDPAVQLRFGKAARLRQQVPEEAVHNARQPRYVHARPCAGHALKQRECRLHARRRPSLNLFLLVRQVCIRSRSLLPGSIRAEVLEVG